MRVGRVHCALKLYKWIITEIFAEGRFVGLVAVVVVSEERCRPARVKEGSGSIIERGGKI